MDDIKALFTAPHTWLFTVGAGAFLGVWWARMTPTMTNVTLAIGVLAFTASAFLHPWVSAQPTIVRALWSIAICSSLSLAAYYTLWTTVVPLSFEATTSEAVQPAGTRIGGVAWSPRYVEVRVFIRNASSIHYRDIDLVIRPDKAVTEAGQVTDIDGVSLGFHEIPTVTPEWVRPSDGQRVAMPVVPIASARGYRVRCEVLPRHSKLEIVLAAVTMHDAQTDVALDRLLTINFGDNMAVWFAHSGHSERVFGPKPTVSSIMVEGEYIAGDKKVTVRERLYPIDHIASVIPTLPR